MQRRSESGSNGFSFTGSVAADGKTGGPGRTRLQSESNDCVAWEEVAHFIRARVARSGGVAGDAKLKLWPRSSDNLHKEWSRATKAASWLRAFPACGLPCRAEFSLSDNRMIDEELSGMRREIAQARELLHDAVEKLVTSFMKISALAHAEVGKVAGGVSVQEAKGLAACIKSEVDSAVTALQFQDMIDQLLNHTLKRLDILEQALTEAGGPEGYIDGGMLAQPSATAGDVSGLSAAKPVLQKHMDPGDVELF